MSLGAGLDGSEKSRCHRGSNPEPPALSESIYRPESSSSNNNNNSIQFNSHLLMCQLNSTVANYKASTKKIQYK